jgi:hypothetical protein
MGNISYSKKSGKRAPAPELILINQELDQICSLFVMHEDLREIFALYFVNADWISSYFEQNHQYTSADSHDNLISYLLPTGGYLCVNDKRSNFFESRAMRPTFNKQLSSLHSSSLTVSLSTSTHSNSSFHGEALRFQSPLMVLAVAIRTFAQSLEMKDWKQRLEARQCQLALKRKPTFKHSPARYLSKLSPNSLGSTRRFFATSSVLPVGEDNNDQEKSTSRMNLDEVSLQYSSRTSCENVSSFSTRSLPSSSSDFDMVFAFSYEEDEGKVDSSSCRSFSKLGNEPSLAPLPPGDSSVQKEVKSPTSEILRLAHLRTFLLSNIHQLVTGSNSALATPISSPSTSTHERFSTSNHSISGRSAGSSNAESMSARLSSSTGSLAALTGETNLAMITMLLSSKQWLQTLVQYLTEECPVAMTLSKPPVDEDDDATYVLANTAFANITQMPTENIAGETLKLFVHESCTETLQLCLLEDAQIKQVPVHLAMTMYHPRTQQKQLHCIAQQPIVSANGTYLFSLAVHYPLPAYGVLHGSHWSEDLQVVEVFTQLMSSLLV